MEVGVHSRLKFKSSKDARKALSILSRKPIANDQPNQPSSDLISGCEELADVGIPSSISVSGKVIKCYWLFSETEIVDEIVNSLSHLESVDSYLFIENESEEEYLGLSIVDKVIEHHSQWNDVPLIEISDIGAFLRSLENRK